MYFKSFLFKADTKEFSFDIQHTKGKDNFIADAFSRMIPIKLLSTENQTEISKLVIIEDFKIPPDRYKNMKSVHNNISGHNGIERTEKN